MEKLKEILRKIFYPRDLTCSICKRESFSGKTVCERCESSLPFNGKSICGRCGRPTAYPIEYCDYCKNKTFSVDFSRSVFRYEEPISKLIRRLKYDGEKYLADELADRMKVVFLRSIGYADGIVYIPAEVQKKKDRGYNQGQLLAVALSEKISVPVLEGAVEKVKSTSSQVGLSVKERMANLKGSFAVKNKSLVKGKRILVVDDVMTTGSTLETVAERLKSAGASEVVALTVASVELRNLKNSR